jgi:SulP family sulfate permease
MLTHAPRYDVLVLMTTFLLTVFTNLVIAVNIGVILAMLLFIRRMAQFVTVEEEKIETLNGDLNSTGLTLPNDVIVYSIQGPFFFGAAEKIEHAFAVTHLDPKTVIFRLKNVLFMDMTGLETFREIIEAFSKRGVKVFLCEANVNVAKKIEKIGLNPLIGGKRIFSSLPETIKYMHL